MGDDDTADRGLLGVGAHTPLAEVRRAYFRTALCHHPDKTGRADTREFVECQLAYHRVLQRSLSPDVPMSVPMPVVQGYTGSVPNVSDICAMTLRLVMLFMHLFEQSHAPHLSQAVQGLNPTPPTSKPDPIVETISVTLDDVYHARVKKVVLNVRQHRGGFQLKKFLVPLVHHRTHHMFPGAGDDGPDGCGDVEIVVRVLDHPSGLRGDKVVDAHDLHLSVPTTLSDFVYGCDVVLPGLPGGEVRLRYGGEQGMSPRTHMRFEGRGLPFLYRPHSDQPQLRGRGHLFVFFEMGPLVRPPDASLEFSGCKELLAALGAPTATPKSVSVSLGLGHTAAMREGGPFIDTEQG